MEPRVLEPIRPTDQISRFIFHSNQFKSVGAVKAAALGPMVNAQTGRLETSVFRTTRMPRDEIWAMCSDYVDKPSANRFAKARGSCAVQVITDEGLYVQIDGMPHPDHADIIGWPEQKDRRKLIQQKIAGKMALDLRR